jgi:hypothetical protein
VSVPVLLEGRGVVAREHLRAGAAELQQRQ